MRSSFLVARQGKETIQLPFVQLDWIRKANKIKKQGKCSAAYGQHGSRNVAVWGS